MTKENKKRLRLAALNASEFIRSHVESGLSPEDVSEKDEKGLMQYRKACEKIADKLNRIADKYKV